MDFNVGGKALILKLSWYSTQTKCQSVTQLGLVITLTSSSVSSLDVFLKKIIPSKPHHNILVLFPVLEIFHHNFILLWKHM